MQETASSCNSYGFTCTLLALHFSSPDPPKKHSFWFFLTETLQEQSKQPRKLVQIIFTRNVSHISGMLHILASWSNVTIKHSTMIWNLDEAVLAFGLHCLINWILPNCWQSDMFTTWVLDYGFLCGFAFLCFLKQLSHCWFTLTDLQAIVTGQCKNGFDTGTGPWKGLSHFWMLFSFFNSEEFQTFIGLLW